MQHAKQSIVSVSEVIGNLVPGDVTNSTWASSDLAGGGHGQERLTHSVMSRRPRPHEAIPRLRCGDATTPPRPAASIPAFLGR